MPALHMHAALSRCARLSLANRRIAPLIASLVNGALGGRALRAATPMDRNWARARALAPMLLQAQVAGLALTCVRYRSAAPVVAQAMSTSAVQRTKELRRQ